MGFTADAKKAVRETACQGENQHSTVERTVYTLPKDVLNVNDERRRVDGRKPIPAEPQEARL